MASSEQPQTLRLALTCAEPPAANEPEATFGLQDARKNLLAGEPQPDGALRFACELSVRRHPKMGAPDFTGPYVHGKLGERFLYLSLLDLRTGAWTRRMKVLLTDIGWDMIEAAVPGAMLSARVGGMRTARAQFESGWHVEM